MTHRQNYSNNRKNIFYAIKKYIFHKCDIGEIAKHDMKKNTKEFLQFGDFYIKKTNLKIINLIDNNQNNQLNQYRYHKKHRYQMNLLTVKTKNQMQNTSKEMTVIKSVKRIFFKFP